MVDHARLALRPGRLAIHPGSRRPARQTALSLCAPSAGARAAGIGRRRRTQKRARIDRLLAAAQFEMELRLGDVAGRADAGDDLAAAHLFPAPDQDGAAMGIGGNPSLRMLDQDQVAIAAQLVADIGDNPAIGGPDRGAARGGDVDPLIAGPIGAGSYFFY